MLFFFLWLSHNIWIHCVLFLKVCYISYLIPFFVGITRTNGKGLQRNSISEKKLNSDFSRNTAYVTEVITSRMIAPQNAFNSTWLLMTKILYESLNQFIKNETENERKRKFPFCRNASHAFGWLFNYSLRILLCSFFICAVFDFFVCLQYNHEYNTVQKPYCAPLPK